MRTNKFGQLGWLVSLLLVALVQGQTVQPCQSLGCYTESTVYNDPNLNPRPADGSTEELAIRALSGAQLFRDQTITLEVCQTFCKDFEYFGPEDGSVCYCGNSLADGSVPVPAGSALRCDKPCPANSQQICGGFKTLSLYRKDCQPPCYTGTRPCTKALTLYKGPNFNAASVDLCVTKDVCQDVPPFGLIPTRVIGSLRIDGTVLSSCTLYERNDCRGEGTTFDDSTRLVASVARSFKCVGIGGPQPPIEPCPTTTPSPSPSPTCAAIPCSDLVVLHAKSMPEGEEEEECEECAENDSEAVEGGSEPSAEGSTNTKRLIRRQESTNAESNEVRVCGFLDICAKLPDPFNTQSLEYVNAASCELYTSEDCSGRSVNVEDESTNKLISSLICHGPDGPKPPIDPCSEPDPSPTTVTPTPLCTPPPCSELISFFKGPF